jgi:hypothetical protein
VGTTSYFVNPESLDKVKAVLWNTEPPLPVDRLYGEMIQRGHFRAACVFPFPTATDPRLVSMINGAQTVIASAFDAVRYAFYADADIAAAAPMFGFRPKSRTNDARLDLLTEARRVLTQ